MSNAKNANSEKNVFDKVNALKKTKIEISIIAAQENRDVYKVLDDMLEIYKVLGSKTGKALKKNKSVTVAEFIAKYPSIVA